MSPFDLDGSGRVALVTGGAAGLGRATVEVFAAAGYAVAIVDVDAAGGSRLAADLAAGGSEALFAAADVASPAAVEAAIRAAFDRWGRLDFVVNNAAIAGRGAPVEALAADELRRVLAVDLEGPFHVCRFAVEAMRGAGGGGIANIASISAERGSPDYAPYAAAKAGVVALTRSLARRVGRYNIRVNCVSPGSIAGTGLMDGARPAADAAARRREAAGILAGIPLGRRAAPRDIAHVLLFLASPWAAHVHGAVLTVDGGESLGPS